MKKECKRLKDLKTLLDVYEKAFGNIQLITPIIPTVKKENGVLVLEFEEKEEAHD